MKVLHAGGFRMGGSMRRVAAAVVDTVGTALCGFGGFWIAYHLTPCAGASDCAPLAPVSLLGALVLAGLYYLTGYLLARRTPGQWLLRTAIEGS